MSTSTKERILNVAERLFAVQGLDSTSLRQITREAEVNLAAVNYHFGSKEGLIQAAFQRRINPINQERLRLLNAYESTVADGEALAIERVLDAFIRPVFELPDGSVPTDPLFLRLVGRLYTDPAEHMRQVFLREFAVVLDRYRQAFVRAVPGLSPRAALWRLHFVVGVLAHALLTGETLTDYTRGLCEDGDYETLQARLVEFCAAGIRAAAESGLE